MKTLFTFSLLLALTIQLRAQTVTDIDGNVYNTVTIGEQVWMAENLRVTKYSDGTPIPLVTDSASWANLGNNDNARCWVLNDSASNTIEYGSLYTWSAAMNGAATSNSTPSGIQGVCPAGWHLPSEQEWLQLKEYLISEGHEQNLGEVLLANSELNGSKSGTDLYGFKVYLCGYRYDRADFTNVGERDLFWSTSLFSSTHPYFLALSSFRWVEMSNWYSKSTGMSVRCLKDEASSNTRITEESSVNFYPNPTNGILYFENTTSAIVKLYNFQGHPIKQWHNPQNQLDVSDVPKGIYFLQLGDKTHKIIIQ